MLQSGMRAAGCAALAASFFGCASTDFVKREVQAMEKRIARVEEGLREGRAAAEERFNQLNMAERNFRQGVEGRVADLEGALRKDLSGLRGELQEARQAVREARDGQAFATRLIAHETVFFTFDSGTLNPGARARLEAFARKLNEGGVYLVEVAGHTDDRGPAPYNYRLGLFRAQAVTRFLAERAPGKAIYSAVTYGMEKPLLPNTGDTNRSKNRRVEVRAYHVKASSAPLQPAGSPAPASKSIPAAPPTS